MTEKLVIVQHLTNTGETKNTLYTLSVVGNISYTQIGEQPEPVFSPEPVSTAGGPLSVFTPVIYFQFIASTR